MKACENKALKKYQLLIDEDKIEERLSKYLHTVKDIITFMGREKNIVVSPLNGRIILLLRSPQHKRHIELTFSLTLITLKISGSS